MTIYSHPGNASITPRFGGGRCFYWPISLLFILLVTAADCSKEISLPQEEILARVGDRVITVNEFIRRAEYAIRPAYCRQDNYIHRKIVLNTLIAEKLLALEAGSDNDLAQNAEFQAYIKGRQEQAMRQYFFYARAYKQARPDTAELKKTYQLAGRTYQMHFVRLPDETSVAAFLKTQREQNLPFDSLALDLAGGRHIPERQVSFNDDPSQEFLNLFYSRPLEPGEQLGPMRNPDGTFLLLQVKGWTTRLAITEQEAAQRWENVHQRLTSLAAERQYIQEVARLMRGKQMVFDEATFYELAERLAPLYIKSRTDKEALFNQQYWGEEIEISPDSTSGQYLAAMGQRPFFTLDGQTWTVADFEKALDSHPLVFRQRNFSRREFPAQFRLAVADLMRDTYITRAAYRAGYDKVPAVRLYTAMWQDNLMALYQRNAYLKQAGFQGESGRKNRNVIREQLNPYIDRLQTRYSAVIEINFQAFEKIRLAAVDMVAMQKGVPYPLITPAFPVLTTDDKLDYGRKMEAQ